MLARISENSEKQDEKHFTLSKRLKLTIFGNRL